MHQPSNKPVGLRRSEHWPLHKAKRRWRQSQRSRIARKQQQERDRIAAASSAR